MPAEIYGERYKFLPRESLLTFEEITRLAGVFAGLGVVKVRLTGGEPLVRADIDSLVGMLARVDGIDDLTMTTNGYLLSQFAARLKDAGLQRITVSLDSLDDEVFRQMNGAKLRYRSRAGGYHRCRKGRPRPNQDHAVVQRGVNDHTIVDLARSQRITATSSGSSSTWMSAR